MPLYHRIICCCETSSAQFHSKKTKCWSVHIHTYTQRERHTQTATNKTIRTYSSVPNVPYIALPLEFFFLHFLQIHEQKRNNDKNNVQLPFFALQNLFLSTVHCMTSFSWLRISKNDDFSIGLSFPRRSTFSHKKWNNRFVHRALDIWVIHSFIYHWSIDCSAYFEFDRLCQSIVFDGFAFGSDEKLLADDTFCSCNTRRFVVRLEW